MTFSPTALALHNACPVLPSDKDIGFYHYATVDTAAAVLAAGYFNAVRDKLHVNDVIRVAADDGWSSLTIKVTASPLKPADGNVTTIQVGGGAAPGAFIAFNVAGGLGRAVTTGQAAAGTARVEVYKVDRGAPLDRAGPRQILIPAADGTFSWTEGDPTIANIFAGAPTLGRQWSAAAGQYTHANSNLENRVMTSLDGINWSAGTVPTDATPQIWEAVAWSPELGLFAAIASGGGTVTTDRVMTSPDGLAWTIRTAAQAHAWRSICWGGPAGAKLFVAVSSTTSVNHVMTSADGITWVTRSTNPFSSSLRGVCWSPDLNLFVAVGNAGTGQRALTSPDGITWTVQSTPADNSWFSVCWAGAPVNKFVACATTGTNGRVMTSPDGVTWTLQPLNAELNGNPWVGVCWSPEKALLVMVASGGTSDRTARSADGINWTAYSGANVANQHVCWSPALGRFIVVSSSGTARVYWSTNASSWGFDLNAPNNSQWYAVAWSPARGRLVAVGYPNSINSELVSWPGLALKTGEKIRFSFDLISGPVNYQFNNPGRVLSGTAYSSAGRKLLQQVISEAADAFGVCADTNIAAGFKTMQGYKDTPSAAARGFYDYYAFAFSFSGLEGPAAVPVLDVMVV